MRRGNILIGTSGWAYDHWRGVFYPDDLPSSEWLKYYKDHFGTTEINNSFYHLPALKTFKNWNLSTPSNFIFSVKVSRFITHIKRLKNVKTPWNIFLRRASGLGKKLGPFLLQFPSSFKKTDETMNRLEKFLAYAGNKHRLSFEFRNSSWNSDDVISLLKSHGAANVIAYSAVYPRIESVSAKFVYIRMHGPKRLFSSNYQSQDLSKLAVLVNSFSSNGMDVYVYFNNDAEGFAIRNGKDLMLKLRVEMGDGNLTVLI